MILMAGAFAAAASALGSQAANQSSDGYAGQYPYPPVQSTGPRAKTESQHTAQENAWLEAERQRGSSLSVQDIPFPVPSNKAVATNPRPQTARQAAENRFLTQERNETDGSVEPAPAASARETSGM
jgi:hypothetical protein